MGLYGPFICMISCNDETAGQLAFFYLTITFHDVVDKEAISRHSCLFWEERKKGHSMATFFVLKPAR